MLRGLRATSSRSDAAQKNAEPALGEGRLLEPGRWGRGGWGLDRVVLDAGWRLRRVSLIRQAVRYLRTLPTSMFLSLSIDTHTPEFVDDCILRNS